MVAAVEATKEIGLAVMATTLSLIAVFVPVAFMGGIPGRFLRSFGMTMAFSIAVSMLVSFSLTPMMASRWLERHTAAACARSASGWSTGSIGPSSALYGGVLSFVMSHRWIVVVAWRRDAGLVRAARDRGAQGLPPGQRRGAVPGPGARARGDEPGRDAASSASASRERSATTPNVKLTLTTMGEDNGEDPQPGDRLRGA